MTDHQHNADTLNRAADLIEERGWVRGGRGMDDSPGARCIQGAIIAAAEMVSCHVTVNLCPVGQAVRDYLDLPKIENLDDFIASQSGLWRWNDVEGRTAAEVIEVLRAVAVIEQARADEHTATDTGYDSAAAMLSVAGDAAARTLAALR